MGGGYGWAIVTAMGMAMGACMGVRGVWWALVSTLVGRGIGLPLLYGGAEVRGALLRCVLYWSCRRNRKIQRMTNGE